MMAMLKPKTLDPVTGPIPRDKFAELVAAPHGQALRAIRQYDPFYGRTTGEKITWAVRFTREVEEEGWGHVEAASEEEAIELGKKLNPRNLNWDVSDRYGNPVFDSVEPEAA